MKRDPHIVILGAGTAGVMLANKLTKTKQYMVTVIEPSSTHYYQPGFLFYPFGKYIKSQIARPTKRLLKTGLGTRLQWIRQAAATILPEANQVVLANGATVKYDVLVVATGTRTDPSLTPGMLDDGWHRNIFDFYSYESTKLLRHALRQFRGGDLVVQVVDMPIKCPVAPLEFTFLVDSYLRGIGLRDKTTITYVTPLSGAFTKPQAAEKLTHLLTDRGIQLTTDFYTEKVDSHNNRLVCYDGRQVPYDLLVTVPTHVGAPVVKASGLADDMGFLEVDKNTLQSIKSPNVFGIGDATNAPTSKAGSVAHFQADTVLENIQLFLEGQSIKPSFDGHANCFIEIGDGKGLLIDFNYTTEPLEGVFPFVGIGPLELLKPSRMNHWGKLAFRHIYWHILLPGRPIPFIADRMSLRGKKINKQGKEKVDA